MAPLLSDVVHGLHVDLANRHHGLRMFTDMLEDPFYTCQVFQTNRNRDLSLALFDVREYPQAYFLEGEFPGIRDKGSITVEWLGKGTLMVEAKPQKMDVAADWGVEVAEPLPAKPKADGDRPKTGGDAAAAPAWRDWLKERQRGSLQRSFTFPKSVNADKLRVKFENGLLKIMVPKNVEEAQSVTKVEIED
jgi:HSP20 family molecular chaperone IbpA